MDNDNLNDKEISNYKEIFRLICFEYRQDTHVKLEIIERMVANIFFPYNEDKIGYFKENFKKDIKNAFKKYTNNLDIINENQFCNAMRDIKQYETIENFENYLEKIFKRHDRNKDGFLDKDEFNLFLECFENPKLLNKDIEEIYENIIENSSNKIGIDLKSFKKHCLNKL